MNSLNISLVNLFRFLNDEILLKNFLKDRYVSCIIITVEGEMSSGVRSHRLVSRLFLFIETVY